jgi:hypothetical protein
MIRFHVLPQAVPRLEGARTQDAHDTSVLRMARLNVVGDIGLEDGSLVAHRADPLPAQ